MSIFDHPDDVPAVHSWRCPHCRTLQAEASRCWRCSRAAVTCATCQLYRTAVTGELGYCAADRSRSPLSGEEVRSCWQARADVSAAPGLFPDHEMTDPAPDPVPIVLAPAPAPAVARQRPVPTPPRPPLEELQAAAWAEPKRGGLVEAPHVEPGRTVMTEVKRRRRFWRRQGSVG